MGRGHGRRRSHDATNPPMGDCRSRCRSEYSYRRRSILAPGDAHDLFGGKAADWPAAAHLFESVVVGLLAYQRGHGLNNHAAFGPHTHVHPVAGPNSRGVAHRLRQSDLSLHRHIGRQLILRNTIGGKSNTRRPLASMNFGAYKPPWRIFLKLAALA